MRFAGRKEVGAVLLAWGLSSLAALAGASLPIPDGSRVLFIGNSLTGSSNGGLPAYANAALTQGGAGIQMQWHRIQIWNDTLETHWNNTGPDTDECTAAGVGIYSNYTKTQLSAKLLLQNGHPDGSKWDYVVLQGYGSDVEDVCKINGTTLEGEFFISTKKFADEIRKYGAQPILYMRTANNPAQVDFSWYKKCVGNLRTNYAAIGTFIDAPVVPVGLIADTLSTNAPAGESLGWLYSDNIHPSDEGLGVQMYAFASILAQKSYKNLQVQYGKYTGIDATLDAAIRNGVYEGVKDQIGGGTPVTKPTAPSAPSATALSASEVEVRFTDNASNETAFNVNYRVTGASSWLNKVYGYSSGTGLVTAVVSGLSTNTSYDFRASATNSAGNSDWTAVVTATTLSSGGGTGSNSVYECELLTRTSSDTVSTYSDALASGGKWDYLAANAVGDYVQYTLNVPVAGTYTVKYRYKKATARGVCQLKIDGVNQGATVNQSGTGWVETDLGSKSLSAGNHTFRFEVTGANGTSYALACDSISLIGGATVDNPPVADAGENLNLIDADNSGSETALLDGGGSTDDYGISNYVWSVGSTQIGTGKTLEHVFDVGSYDVTLTVTDTAGQTNSDMMAVIVEAGSGGTASNILAEAELLTKTFSDKVSTYADALASGGKWDYLAANATGDYVEYSVNVAVADTYTIKYRYKKAAARGICQLKIDGVNQGSTVNQSGTGWVEVDLGTKSLTAGNHLFRFEVTGANGTSYALSVDNIQLIAN
jgi:hypothetical protein